MKIIVLCSLLISLNTWAASLNIIFSRGKYQVIRDGKAIDTKSVLEGDEVRLEDKSLVLLKGVQETIKLTSSTIIKLKTFSEKTEIELITGSIISKISKKPFSVMAKKVSMGVRGTQFFVSYDEKKNVWMCVEEGVVNVNDGIKQNVDVNAGEGLFVVDEKVGKPKKYEWTKKINWEMDETKNLDVNVKIEARYDDLLDHHYD
jgi:ferric-dicitrate binding protein FerR (iron transport regulator)